MTYLFYPFLDHCLEDLSHQKGDSQNEQMSAHDPGCVNGTRSSSHFLYFKLANL